RMHVVLDVLLLPWPVGVADQMELKRGRAFIAVDLLIVPFGANSANRVLDHWAKLTAVCAFEEMLFNDLAQQAGGVVIGAAWGATGAGAQQRQRAQAKGFLQSVHGVLLPGRAAAVFGAV